MRILFLDLASHASCIALVDADRVVAEIAVDHRVSDHEVLPLLDQLLAKAGWTIEDVERIACVTGPGGFTSLRVAVTLANTLADQLSVPMAGVHTSNIYKARLQTTNYKLPTLWLHSTKSTALFFRDLSDPTSEPSLITLDELKERLPEHCQWTGELIPAHRAVVDAKKCIESPLQPLKESLPPLLDHLHYRSEPLSPWYGRGW
jgi:tRNA threonylcarbamoyladenosine biosynthesis protein TsaB